MVMIRPLFAAMALAACVCLGTAAPAAACTVSSISFKEAFAYADTVLFGTVRSIDDASVFNNIVGMNFDKVATLTVGDVWKGHAAASEELAYTEFTPACGFELQTGQSITLFARRGPDGLLFATRYGVAGIGVNDLDTMFLSKYRTEADSLRQQARSGGMEEGFAFAAYLTRWNDPRALEVYQNLLDRFDRDAEAYLGIGIALARDQGNRAGSEAAIHSAIATDVNLKPILESARPWPAPLEPLTFDDQVSRAIFMLIGEFSEYGSDWSNLVANSRCAGEDVDFSRAYFDTSDMTQCAFQRSRFEEVSFVKAKLAGVSFEFTDLKDIDFSDADLDGASFKFAHLSNVNWTNADLRNANFSSTRAAGPFQDVDLRGASFAGALRPGPFVTSDKDGKFSLEGVSFRNATVAVSAFLLTPENTMADGVRADISRADFSEAVLDCGERNKAQMKRSLEIARDRLLPSYLAEQRLAGHIRDSWPDVTLTERCREFLATEL